MSKRCSIVAVALLIVGYLFHIHHRRVSSHTTIFRSLAPATSIADDKQVVADEVARLIQHSNRDIAEGKYVESLAVVGQIEALDPDNSYAKSVLLEAYDPPTHQQHRQRPTFATTQQMLAFRLPAMRFQSNSFSDVVDYIGEVANIQIIADWNGLAKAGISQNALITLRIRDINVNDALLLIFKCASIKNARATFQVRDNKIIISAEPNIDAGASTQPE
jgi:hypothetical protein